MMTNNFERVLNLDPFRLSEDQPMICHGCSDKLKAGDLVCFMPIGPGNDLTQAKKCHEGKAYNSVAIIVHWSCATGEVVGNDKD